MKRKMLFGILLGVGIFVMVAIQCYTQQPPQQPGAPSGRPAGFAEQMMIMQALPLDSSWDYLCFELDTSDEQLIKARNAYKEAWKLRKENILSKMEDARGDANALRELKSSADKIKASLDTKIKTVLTPEQMTKFTTWEKENRERRGRMPGAQPGAQQR